MASKTLRADEINPHAKCLRCTSGRNISEVWWDLDFPVDDGVSAVMCKTCAAEVVRGLKIVPIAKYEADLAKEREKVKSAKGTHAEYLAEHRKVAELEKKLALAEEKAGTAEESAKRLRERIKELEKGATVDPDAEFAKVLEGAVA